MSQSSSSVSSVTSSTDGSSSDSSSDSSVEEAPKKRVEPFGIAGMETPRNPTLRFERPDNEYIPLPQLRDAKQLSRLLFILLEDTTRYPWGHYRMIDYFRTAVKMFIAEVRLEYGQQSQASLRNGKAITRFTWKNKGELAVCFACVCDMMKLLYNKIRPGPLKPLWQQFVMQLAPVLMGQSQIPSAVLSSNTYHTKFLDWEKGGTRYGGESSKANVRFPSATDRQVKVETFLKSGDGYQIQAVTVDPSTVVTVPKPVLASPANHTPPPLVPAFVPVKTATGRGSEVLMAPRQVPEEMRHLFWLSTLAHVKGGKPTAAFPDERAPLMTAFGRLCDMSKTAEEMMVLVRVMRASSAGIHTIFERLGGLFAFRKFATFFILQEQGEELMLLVDTVARMRMQSWRRLSQEAWCTNLQRKRGMDLQWLRQLPLIPVEKRAVWGALIVMMEEKFVFAPSTDTLDAQREQELQAPTRLNSLRAAAADNYGLKGWKWPRIHTFNAKRMPEEWRAPLFISQEEEVTLETYIQEKQKFLDNEQRRWHQSITQMVETERARRRVAPSSPTGGRDDLVAAGEEIPIPVWYDPLQVLGIEPPLKVMKLEDHLREA